MVRTSDFQSENGGSIPPSPIMFFFENIDKIKGIEESLNKKIKYSFLFVSLVSPFLVNNLRLMFYKTEKEKKVLVKQSYMMLTWFYYMSFLNQKNDDKYKLKFFILPTKKKIFTLTRAPMAHKNWSKEQYKFQFYKFQISFVSSFKQTNSLNSLNASLMFVILSKKFFPNFETNLMFLKTLNIFFYAQDKNFFNYNSFIRKKLK